MSLRLNELEINQLAESGSPESLALVRYLQRLKHCSSEAYMARRLSFQKLLLGLALATTLAAVVDPPAYAQDPPPTPPQPKSPQPQSPQPGDAKANDKASADHPAKNKPDDKDHREGRRDGENRRDGERARHDGDRREGRRGPVGIIEMMAANPEFLLEFAKRDGGPLELLAPLLKPEVRKELALDPQHAAAADKFLKDMNKRFEDDLNALNQQLIPNFREMFEKRLKAENEEFEKLLATLPSEQRERLIGIYVQYRNLRAVSNRVIAVDKLGMTKEQAEKLRKDVHQIRMETFREIDERDRDKVINSGMVQPPNLHKVREIIDARIKKLLTKEQLETLDGLRGKELPPELIEQLDRPPLPPPPPVSPTKK